MELRIINPDTFNTIDIVESYISCIWHVEFSGFGDFELHVPYNSRNKALFQKGRIIYRVEDSETVNGVKQAHNAMFIESIITAYTASEGIVMRITGRGVKSILCLRIVWEQTNFDEELFGAIIYNLVNDNFTNPEIENRTITGISAPSVIIGGPLITAQLHGENIGDWVQEQAKAHNFGWEIIISGIDAGTGPSYEIAFIEGDDKTASIVFSPEYNNLLSCEFTDSLENFKNVALVGGEGEGTDQIQTAVSVGNKVGMNRHEMYVNGVSRSTNSGTIALATYKKMLQQFGMSELIKYTDTMSATGEIDTNGVFKIGEDYDLGDKVRIELEGLTGSAYLTEIIYSDDNTGYSTIGTFGEWEVYDGN